jgi:hypothetical protein
MFISKKEKASIDNRISRLETMVENLMGKITLLQKAPTEIIKMVPYQWSEQQRKAQSDRMKQVWASKREPRV